MTENNSVISSEDDSAKKYSSSHEIIYEEFDKKTLSTLSDGDCAVCKRKGLTLFLTRKSVLPKDFKAIDWSRGMQKFANEPNIDFKTHKYAFRKIREGFVYILLEANDKSSRCYLGYEVTSSGMFRHKPVEEMATLHPNEIPNKCITNKDKHYVNGNFITIDSATDRYAKAWIAYSHRSWSKKVRDLYIDLPEDQLQKRFVSVNLKNMLAENKNPRIFPLTDFESQSKYLAELECDSNEIVFFNDESTTNKDNKNIFYTSSRFNSLKSDKTEFFEKASRAKNGIYNQNAVVVVLDDFFGIAEELALSKKQLIMPLALKLAKFDASLKDEIKSDYGRKILSLNNQHEDKMVSPVDILLTDKEKEELDRQPVAQAKNEQVLSQMDINKSNYLHNLQPKTIWDAAKPAPFQLYDSYLFLSGYFSLKSREDQIDLYYRKFLSAEDKVKLNYFDKQLSFRRQIKNCINIFKSGLKESLAYGKDDVRYVFYNGQNKVLGIDTDDRRKTFVYSLEYCQPWIYDEEEIGYHEQPRYMFKIHYPMIDIKFMQDITSIDDKSIKLAVEPGSYGDCKQIELPNEERDRIIKSYQNRLDTINDYSDGEYYDSLSGVDKSSTYIKKVSGLKNFTREDLKITRVEKYIYPLTGYNNSAAEFSGRWNKYNKRLSPKLIKTFDEIDQAAYENLKEYVELNGEDHKDFIVWLFLLGQSVRNGSKNTSSDEKAFWQIEIEAVSSDAHIGYLSDIASMLDTGDLGDLKLETNFQIWDSLLTENQNLFKHVLFGEQGGLWTAIYNQKEACAKENENVSTADIVKQLIDIIDKISSVEIQAGQEKNAIKLTQLLYEKFTTITASGVMHLPEGKYLSNQTLANAFFTDAGVVLTDIYPQRFSAKISVSELPNIMKKMESQLPSLNGIDSYHFKDPTGLTEGYKVIRDRSGHWKLDPSISGRATNKMAIIEFLYLSDSLDEVNALRNKSNQDLFEKGYRFFREENSKLILARPDLTIDQAISVLNNQIEIKKLNVENTQVLIVNALTLPLNAWIYHNNAIMIDSLGVAGNVKSTLRQSNRSIFVTSITAAVQVASAAAALVVGLRNASNIGFEASTNALKTVQGIGEITKWAGVLGSFIGIVDGCMSYYGNLDRLANGDSGALGYQLGCIFEITAGVLGLIAAVGITIPGIGWVIAGLAVIGIGLKLYFSDDSANWDLMEWWLNRCEYGMHEKLEQRESYPSVDTSVYQCLSDFYTYIKGYQFFFTDKDLEDGDTLLAERTLPSVPLTARISRVASMAMAPAPKIAMYTRDWYIGKTDKKAGYLNVILPDFVEKKSVYTIKTTIISKDYTGQAVLHVENSTNNLGMATISKFESTPTDINKWFVVDNQSREKNDSEKYRFGDKKIDKDEIEENWYHLQKVCELVGNYTVYSFIHYYPNGKSEGEFPIIIEYRHN